MASAPETQYALSGSYHIAYQVADGAADRDILYAPRTTTPIDLLWDDPIVARGLRRLTACGRLITCDLRGWGASDSIDTTRLPAMQAWMDDIGAVLDAAGSDQATLIAGSETGLPMMLFACQRLFFTEKATGTSAVATPDSSLSRFPAPSWSRSPATTTSGSQATSSRCSTRSN